MFIDNFLRLQALDRSFSKGITHLENKPHGFVNKDATFSRLFDMLVTKICP